MNTELDRDVTNDIAMLMNHNSASTWDEVKQKQAVMVPQRTMKSNLKGCAEYTDDVAKKQQ